MRDPSTPLFEKWNRLAATGQMVGRDRPIGRMTLSKQRLRTVASDRPGPWRYNLFQGGEREFGTIKSIDISRSVGDDAATCTITLYNDYMTHYGSEPQGIDTGIGRPGFLTFNRGDRSPITRRSVYNAFVGPDDEDNVVQFQDFQYDEDGNFVDPAVARDIRKRAKTNLFPTDWGYPKAGSAVEGREYYYDRLIPNRLIRTYQGYGSANMDPSGNLRAIDDEEYVAPWDDSELVCTGHWLVDTVTYTSEGLVTLTCRDLAKVLLEQVVYPPMIPLSRFPLTYCPETKPSGEKGGISQNRARGYEASSNDVWFGRNARVRGHRPSDAFDGRSGTYWLSVGNRLPDGAYSFEWLQTRTGGDLVNEVVLRTKGTGYTVFVSVMEKGGWVGERTVPYDPNSKPAFPNGANIRYVLRTTVGSENETVIKLPRAYQADRVRVALTNLWDSNQGPFQRRAAVREFRVRYNQPNTYKAGTIGQPGYISDWSDAVKELCAWAGFTYKTNTNVRSGQLLNLRTSTRPYSPPSKTHYDTAKCLRRMSDADTFAEIESAFNSTVGEAYGVTLQVHTEGAGRVGTFYDYSDVTSDMRPEAKGYLRAIATALSHYPPRYVKGLPLSRLHFHADFRQVGSGSRSAATAFSFGPDLYFDITDYRDQHWSMHVFHHELMHNAAGGDPFWGNGPRGWLAANPPTFHYRDRMGTHPQNQPEGFASNYGQTNFAEDLAEVMTELWEPNSTLPARLANDAGLRTKVQILIGWLTSKGMRAFNNHLSAYGVGASVAADPLIGRSRDGENLRVWGDFEDLGAGPVECTPSEFFLNKSFAECISTIKDFLGCLFFIDESGGAQFRFPNLFTGGNFIFDPPTGAALDRGGRSAPAYVKRQWPIEFHENANLISYSVTVDDSQVRSEILVVGTNPDTNSAMPLAAGVVLGTNPISGETSAVNFTNVLGGQYRLFMVPGSASAGFKTVEECQRMAELIGLKILQSYRKGSAQITGHPGLQIDDQVRIFERITNEYNVHYVSGIQSRMDVETGEYLMDVTTHWLGDDPDRDWFLNHVQLTPAVKKLPALINRLGDPMKPPPGPGGSTNDPATGNTSGA